MSRLSLLLTAFVGVVVLACGQGEGPTSSYEQSVMQDRVQRDMRMREDESVLPPNRRDSFRGLDYYEVNPAYHVKVSLERFEAPDTVMIAESTGGVRPQVRIGRLTAPLPPDTVNLVVFRGESDDPRGRLWIPFSDSTNGHGTYKGGRYVDLQSVTEDSVVVDFNRAYNPTCTYNPDYACPLPPPENRIAAPIPAGEKKPLFGSEKG